MKRSITGFFNNQKPLQAPPRELPKHAPREEWTTEAYIASAFTPESTPIVMGVAFGEPNMPFEWGADAHLVLQPTKDGSGVPYIPTVVMNGVKE